jgi:hypothetical protein
MDGDAAICEKIAGDQTIFSRGDTPGRLTLAIENDNMITSRAMGTNDDFCLEDFWDAQST